MRTRAAVPVLVTLFLAAIVAANLISTHYGPSASVWNAFFLIGLDLTTRDRLHDFWGNNLASRWWKLGALIASGSVLSWLLNRDAATIAEASAIAFAAATAVDTIGYTMLRNREWLERANTSNVFSAAVDSIVFPTLAFGSFKWPITFGQFTAKVAGGFVWSLLIGRIRRDREPDITVSIDSRIVSEGVR